MPHVFISYVRQDSQPVERLCNSLRENGVRIWIDRDNLRPGTRWKQAIRKAIKEGDYFIACFSPQYLNRASTYMNEELTLAIEILRQMPVDRAWFIPVLLSECEVPDREIGAGETLLDIQQVRLYEDWEPGIRQILSVIKPKYYANEDDLISILFLAANPSDVGRLQVDRELREIQMGILQSESRDRFHLEVRTAVRLEDLQSALIFIKPRIVHFAGAGASTGEILLEDNAGRSRPVSAAELAHIFASTSSDIDCVIFNVSYSSGLAHDIAREVKYVIAMNGAVGDKAAIKFASAFYQALEYGRSIEDAFELGRAQVLLEGLHTHFDPILLKKKG